ncbi:putative peptidase [Golovinomyces cichoracearum]|uniref:Putative peptidase n=1 Tax=Golovinomyces cichoracearum TaxID=62708 RepID=A0A420J7L0_9PEZI|nr:putative peptidase [Golovinomyces cichoracearum]
MCGRYALGYRPDEIRTKLRNDGINIHEIPENKSGEALLPNYNLAPGNFGYVCLAQKWSKTLPQLAPGQAQDTLTQEEPSDTSRYDVQLKLQIMKWGLVPSWAKQMPDYGSLFKTINCRDDSLQVNTGMWTSMKCTKRCVVIAMGYYEWLKKSKKIPHFIKRKDGKPLFLAGLYDCVQLEGSNEKLFTYTIITTNANKQSNFLHDRMPAILDNNSDDLHTWLDINRSVWCKDLQYLLKPYDGDLEIYPVSNDVGKLSNNSPRLIIPVTSTENKMNIANFFRKGEPKIQRVSAASNMEKGTEYDSTKKSSKKTNTSRQEEKECQKLIEFENEKDTPLILSPKDHQLNKKRHLSESLDFMPRKKVHQISSPSKATSKPLVLNE